MQVVVDATVYRTGYTYYTWIRHYVYMNSSHCSYVFFFEFVLHVVFCQTGDVPVFLLEPCDEGGDGSPPPSPSPDPPARRGGTGRTDSYTGAVSNDVRAGLQVRVLSCRATALLILMSKSNE